MSNAAKDSFNRSLDDIENIKSKMETSKTKIAELQEQLTKEEINLKQLEQDLDKCVQAFKDLVEKVLE